MGMLTEKQILQQAKKGQGETSDWLRALHEEQQRTNELLEQLIQVMQGQPRQWAGHEVPR